MKKSLTLGLAAVFATVLLTGCKPKEEAAAPETTTEAPAVVEETGTMMTTPTETTPTETGTMMTTPGAATTTPETPE